LAQPLALLALVGGGVLGCRDSRFKYRNTMKTNCTISINGVKFAPSSSALVESLFNPEGTASGIYKIKRNGVLFCNPNGEPFLFLVANRSNPRFFVSCSKQEDGRIRYFYSISSMDEKKLGIDSLSYGEKNRLAESIWETVSTQ
jgi:hypothetical protein